MSSYLSINESKLKEANGYWTAREIAQQPDMWLQTTEQVNASKEKINAWLKPLLALDDLRIILTGAGTSAYIGETLAPLLNIKNSGKFEAIATTDIVSSPKQYLHKNRPTLMVSYGRSGSSPESVASVELADQCIEHCYHLVITCNPEGELALKAASSENMFALVLPSPTLDQSFAMTSSFTSMIVASLSIFQPDEEQLASAVLASRGLLGEGLERIKAQASLQTKRMVFLGSGGLQGIAKEAALKVLELTAGDVMSYYESPLGFRHGPKSLVNQKTEIILFSSSDPYGSLYEQDLYKELVNDGIALSVTQLNSETLNIPKKIDDVWCALPYILYCQIIAFFKSFNGGHTPDNPCPTGEVNRVVQGVTIYRLENTESEECH
ncbi:SIS domain-containing protein [Parashewanella curva]|uniref:SIS domain-containing protein n=1 Tax=Parashewanella curva TaxID=2338552 RepID=A0A3L8PWE7_9GAMM|nr:SIS domain-containing protein [Parashewanella curva]RLV59119.1 SIS domain-containing protein [Parashewanella curva]